MFTKKFLIFFFLITISFKTYSQSVENKIKFKVDGEIITTFDITKESKYLSILNPQIKNLNKDKIYQISKNSLIREKIKNAEILKKIKNPKINDQNLNNAIRQTYLNLNFNSIEDFETYLNNNNLNLETIKKKFEIELLWNQLIYFKYIDKVKIDRNELIKDIKETNNQNIQYLLHEILIDAKDFDSTKQKIINNSIIENGFENTATLYSISDTSKIGGRIGWINQNSLNKSLIDQLYKLEIGQITSPIRVQGGFLILKVFNKKVEKIEINLEEELNNLVKKKTNEQLNQYSNIYYNKTKNNIKIDEL